MTDEERRQLKEHVDRWKTLGPLMEEQREEDTRRSDTISAFAFFAQMPLRNLSAFPPAATSGLVEQQLWFQNMAGR
jgi:hypothetical protein